MSTDPTDTEPVILLAAAVCDANGAVNAPGAVAVQSGHALRWGEPAALGREFHGARSVNLDDRFGPALVLPEMVNAHAHLDLSGVGPRPYGGDFMGWARAEVIPARRLGPAAGAAAVRAGAAASLAAGVGVVGDVAGSPEARAALPGTGLRGVAFEELFGLRPAAVGALARRAAEVAAEEDPPGGVRRGLQPHAPYSVSPEGYAACVATGLPLSTHLAELEEEAELVRDGTGPVRATLEEMGLWGPELGSAYGGGLTPVAWLRPQLEAAPGRFVVAHANHVDDGDIADLARTRTSVAYCPVASAYFGHAGHRYREMLDAGVNVALGTDSVLCQPPGEPQPHGVLAQMRFLFRRDATEPSTLVSMAVRNGFRALGTDARPRRLTLVPIDPDAADPLRFALAGSAPAVGLGVAAATAAG